MCCCSFLPVRTGHWSLVTTSQVQAIPLHIKYPLNIKNSWMSYLSFSSLMWGMSLLSPSFPRSLSSLLSAPLAQLGPTGNPDGPPCRRFHGSWWLGADKPPTTLAGESLGPNMEPAADQRDIVLLENKQKTIKQKKQKTAQWLMGTGDINRFLP